MKKETGVIAFEITGDSMENGTHESFKKGMLCVYRTFQH